MRRTRILKTVRIIWILGGLCFTLWLVISYQAWGVPPEVLRSDETVTVHETGASINFTPRSQPQALTFIFLPGAFVDPHAYAPMSHALAENGFSTVILKLPFRAALFAAQEAQVHMQILNLIQQAPAQTWVLGGHSRGGGIAARFAAKQPALLDSLVLMGTSLPKAVEDDLSVLPLQVVKLYGTRDGLASEAEVLANRRYLPPDARMIRIEGGNHAQFGWYSFQLGDQTASITRAEQQQVILTTLLDLFVELLPPIQR